MRSLDQDSYWRGLEVLVQARKNAGLRQQDVATKLGVTQGFVSRYERGERRLDYAEACLLCNILGIDISDIIR